MNKSDSGFRWLIVAAAVAVLGVSCWILGAKDRDREAAVALLQAVREVHWPRIERLKEAQKALVGLSATDPAVEQWMREANAAIAISEDMAECLERLRAHALPETALERVEGRWRFHYEDKDCAYLDRTLVDMLRGVDWFSRDGIQGLCQSQLDAVLLTAQQLAEQLASALDRPEGVTGDGPSAWLRAESAAIEAQWMQSSATSNVARWEATKAKAEKLLLLAGQSSQSVRDWNDVKGFVPGDAWRGPIDTFLRAWWAGDVSAADASIAGVIQLGRDPALRPALQTILLRRAGLAAAAGSSTDRVTRLPKRVVHAKTGIEMVLIPAGEFTMGSPANEVGRRDDEKQHQRVIREPFYMGVTEVTQLQWRKVMGNSPSKFKGDTLPVESVSWDDCQKFLQKVGDGMRLPSEAEWEYACRAGSSSPFSFGAHITPQQVNYDGDYPYNGAAKGLDRGQTVPVGSLPANAWGLHEMHGNVREWCQDVYAAYPDRGTEAPNSDSGPNRVYRGGGWLYYADICRSAFRGSSIPGFTSVLIGFRVVLAPVLVQ
jgi:sulfatase modifying factor 1